MKLRIWSGSLWLIAGTSLVSAADPQLLNLVMPNAQVVAGVNVDSAKTSAFGQYVVGQIQSQDPNLQQLVSQTGFDPTQDLDELLMASAGPHSHTGLTLARGTFDTAKIEAAAQSTGATSEVYNGVTIFEDPKHAHGFAFLSATIAIAGDVASVKGAIDRQTTPAPLPAALLTQINQWSTTQDAWAISEVPPPALQLPANNANLSQIPTNALQNIQQSAGGVKFGSQIVMTAQLQSDTPQDATALAGVLQFLVNFAQLQAQQKNSQAASALQSVTITTNENVINVSDTVPEAAAESLFPLNPEIRKQAPTPRGRRL
jgi:hypothetical protein